MIILAKNRHKSPFGPSSGRCFDFLHAALGFIVDWHISAFAGIKEANAPLTLSIADIGLAGLRFLLLRIY